MIATFLVITVAAKKKSRLGGAATNARGSPFKNSERKQF